MNKVKLRSSYATSTPKCDTTSYLANAFNKIDGVRNPLLSNELMRKRQVVASQHHTKKFDTCRSMHIPYQRRF